MWMRTPKCSERNEQFECKIYDNLLMKTRRYSQKLQNTWVHTVGVELLFCQTDGKEKWKFILNTTRKGNYSKCNFLLPVLKSRGGLEWYFTLCISFTLFLSLCGCSLDFSGCHLWYFIFYFLELTMYVYINVTVKVSMCLKWTDGSNWN